MSTVSREVAETGSRLVSSSPSTKGLMVTHGLR